MEYKQNSTNQNTITIIGNGLAATCSAYILAQQNYKIFLIDDTKNIAASFNPFGILAPLITHKTDPIGKFYELGFLYSLEYLKTLSKLSAAEDLFLPAGMIDLSKNWAEKNITNINLNEGLLTILNNDEIKEISGLNLPASNALYIKNAVAVSPQKLCLANIAAIQNPQISIIKQVAHKVSYDGNEWQVLNLEQQIISSSKYLIIATGFNTEILSNIFYKGVKHDLAPHLKISPVRGQLSFLNNFIPNLKTIICYHMGYITPVIGGVNYVGATYKRGNTDLNLYPKEHQENLDNLERMLGNSSGLDRIPTDGRAAVRACTIDRRPIIGQAPNLETFVKHQKFIKNTKIQLPLNNEFYLDGLYLNIGHGSRGLCSAPIAGEIITSLITNKLINLNINNTENKNDFSVENILDILDPARFIVKKLKN